MTPDERSHNEKLLDTNRKRLRVLELQVAQFGLYAPPHIVIEIADLKKEIERIEGLLGVVNNPGTASKSLDSTRINPFEQRTFAVSEVTRLVELLLAAPSVANRSTRDSLVQLLPNSITNSIVRNDTTRVDVLNIVRTTLNYPNGLNDLIEAIRWFEGGSIAMQNIDSFIKSLS